VEGAGFFGLSPLADTPELGKKIKKILDKPINISYL
jgi:hypothetical protein